MSHINHVCFCEIELKRPAKRAWAFGKHFAVVRNSTDLTLSHSILSHCKTTG
jgi:hypothetical protein